MIVLDASVAVALVSPSDVHADVALDIVLAYDEVVMHGITWAEVLVRPARHGLDDLVNRQLREMGIACGGVDEAQPGRLARLRARTRLPMPDCCVLDTAMERDGAIATFDHRLIRSALDLRLEVISAA